MISHASLALVAILRSSTRCSRPASRSTPSRQIFCSMVSRLLGQSPARGVGQYRVPVQAALDRAWDLRKKIVNRVRAVPASDNLQKIWGATIEDVEEGSTLGPFTHPDSRCLSSFDVRTGSRLKDSRSSKRTKFAAATAPQQT